MPASWAGRPGRDGARQQIRKEQAVEGGRTGVEQMLEGDDSADGEHEDRADAEGRGAGDARAGRTPKRATNDQEGQ